MTAHKSPEKSKEAFRQFGVKQPCSGCPFRLDDTGVPLESGRKEEIIKGLLTGEDNTFPCHKTVYREDGRNFDDNEAYDPVDVSVCAGAAAVCETAGRDMVMVQLGKRLGVIDDDHYQQASEQSLRLSDLDLTLEECHLKPES